MMLRRRETGRDGTGRDETRRDGGKRKRRLVARWPCPGDTRGLASGAGREFI